MKKLSVILYVYFASATILSCSTTTLLNATFEGDDIGSHPDRSLPGAPAGDLIDYNPVIEPQLIVGPGTITPGVPPGKALNFTDAPTTDPFISGHHSWVSFKGASTNLTNTVWIIYTAKNTDAVLPLFIVVSDGTDNVVARMRIEANGDISLARNILDDYTDPIGNVGTTSHTVIFSLNFATLQYGVTIFKYQRGVITATNKSMITQNVLEFANPANPSISFSYQNARGNRNQKYIIEEIQITKRIPDIMR